MSKLLDAMNSWKPQGRSTQGGIGSAVGYRQATVGANPDLAGGPDLSRLAQLGMDIYSHTKEKAMSKADERSNEIIRKLTPEQRREAINNGTLLYQDDPYAMKALREKTGRNAAFQIDDEVSQKINAGEFRTRADMEAYRHKRLTEGSKEFAELFGITEGDEDYQRGLNADITQRNVNLYGRHDTFLSDQAQKGALLNGKLELNGVLSSPEMLARADSGQFFEAYINQGLATGSLASDAQASQLITSSINDVVQRPGGAKFLQNIEGRKVTLNGVTTTYKDLMGEEQWNSLMVKAQHSQFQNDAKLTEKLRLDINSATNQADATAGWEMLQGIKDDLNKRQPGEQMTPEREMLQRAQEAMMDRFNRESAATAKATDDQRKTLNKSQVIDEQFTKRLNGDYVSTDFKDMPTNENTGEFKHSDMVNFANSKLAQIEAMNLPEDQKDRLKLDYLRVDSEGGAFRTAVGTLVTDAGNEWSAAVINGEMPEATPAMDALRRLRNADPNLVAALYPDKADLFLTMDMMDSMGIKSQKLIDAANMTRGMSKEAKFEADEAYKVMKNNSLSPEIKYLPARLDSMARKIYDATLYASGNPDMAAQQVDKFLKESTSTFTADDVDGDTIGVIPKVSLQVSSDPKSWEQGRDIIDTARKQLIKDNPWVANKQMMVYMRGDTIHVMDTTGQVGVSYTKERLQGEYQETARKQAEAAREKALKDAQKRAPISQATKARKVARERVIQNKRKVPRKIYGSE